MAARGQRRTINALSVLPEVMLRPLSLLLGGLFAGIVHAGADAPPTGTSAALAILAEVLPADAYTRSEVCISVRGVRRVDVLDSRHVLFFTRREAWLNRLPLDCRDMRPGSLLEFEAHGARLCQQDMLRVRERGVAVVEDTPRRCRLGRFEPVELQQAQMLREQFRRLRRTRDDRPDARLPREPAAQQPREKTE